MQRPRTPSHSATNDVAVGFASGVLATAALVVVVAIMRAAARAWGVDTALIARPVPVAVIFILAALACREETRR